MHRQRQVLLLYPGAWDRRQLGLEGLSQGPQLGLQPHGLWVTICQPRASDLQAMIPSEVQCQVRNVGLQIPQGPATHNGHLVPRVVQQGG
jgi:hypothetical protein